MPTNPTDTHTTDPNDAPPRTERLRPKPTPSARTPEGTSPRAQVAIAVALIAVGAIGALLIEHAGTTGGIPVAAFATPGPKTPEPSAAEPSLDLSASPEASAAASALASESASPSPTPASAVLEAALPHYVKSTALSVQSIVGLSQLGQGPAVRSMGAALASYGTKADTLEVAEAYDPGGSLNLTVLGFRQPGLDVAKLRTVILDSWLVANVPGVKTSAVTLSGLPATEIDYGAGGKTEWLLVKGDSVFDIAADNRADAEAAVAAFGNKAPATNPGSPSPGTP